MSVLKKPYEISLWDDILKWYRLPLRAIKLTKDSYEPGVYYSQKPTAFGALPYVPDYEDYQEGQRYYTIDTSSSLKLVGTRAEQVALTSDWYPGIPRRVVRKVDQFASDVKYYIFSNTTGSFSEVDKKDGPKAGQIYFVDSIAKDTPVPNVVGQYYEEKKLCVLGSNTMTAPIRAVKPKLVSKVNGENTLDFTVYSHYTEDGEIKWNPFMAYLTNERKVKLRYDGKWYDFIIKNISEDSSSKAFTYTCKDLFVNELSKTGFGLVFDHELGNNMGNLPRLAKEILKESDWELREGIDTVLQYLEEGVYSLTLSSDSGLANQKMSEIYGENGYNTPCNLPLGKTIYVFHSSVDEQTRTSNMQFLYDPTQKYRVDDKNTIIGYSKDTPKGISNFTIEGVFWQKPQSSLDENDLRPHIKVGGDIYCLSSSLVTFEPSKKGERLVRSQKTEYDKRLKRAVKIYNSDPSKNDGGVYGFEDTEYISAATVVSYVTTPSDFENTSGWRIGKASAGDTETAELQCLAFPELTSSNYNNYMGCGYLKFSPTKAGQVLVNSGIWDNRSAIGSFVCGEEYILNLIGFSKPPSNPEDPTTGEDYSSDNIELTICEYKLESEYFSQIGDPLFTFSLMDTEQPRGTKKYKCSCLQSISKDDFKQKRLGIFIKANTTEPLYLQKMEFYPFKLDANGKECVPGTIIEPEVKTVYFYYDKNATFTSEGEVEYLYRGNEPRNDYYTPYYGLSTSPEEAFEKIRSITARESNRFNLLQSLCELFQCWVQFEIEHEDNGKIALTEGYRQKKWVTYKKYIGKDNAVGFKYGINLESIKRTLDSSGAISKIIVKNNANELGEGGFCSISRAKESPTGENFIYNFDYYIGQGLLNFNSVNADLNGQYNIAQGYMGYYRQLKDFNNIAQRDAETLSQIVANLVKYDSQYQAYKYSAETAEEQIIDKKIEFKDLTQVEFDSVLEEFQQYDAEKHRPLDWEQRGEKTWWRDRDILWGFYYNKNEGVSGQTEPEYVSLLSEYQKIGVPGGYADLQAYLDAGFDECPVATGGKKTYYARFKWWDDNRARAIKNAIARLLVVTKTHKVIYENQLLEKTREEERKSIITNRLEAIKKQKLALNQKFYQKYSRFIQEGSWISEDYYDDDLYYIDALSTLYTSSRPQVKYTIDVIDLSQLTGYNYFQFALGDKTYVEDKEFFGRAYDGSGRLYREEVIVSEVSLELDSPESNKITVQNYKTQFEDLFQRIVATTQQVQFSTGEYKRAAAIVQEDGTLNVSTLQNSFLNNSLILQNAKDQSVLIGDDGITTTNLSCPNEMLRIVSGGIFISNDGGESWITGIYAGGINASCITSGQLNVSEVNLTMGQDVAFRWDKLGINAYKRTANGISPGTFTRFDQFGLYGIMGPDTFDPLEYNQQGHDNPIEYIQSAASFGLTWDRFWLRSTGTEGYVSISSENDFEVKRKNSNSQMVSVITIGRLEPNGDQYGIRISNLDGNPVLETDQSGKLMLQDKLTIATDPGKTVQIGNLGQDNTGEKVVINASDLFKVYQNGSVVAENIRINADGIFSGEIYATGGSLGGLSIQEWREMGFALRIESSNGWVLRDGQSTKLTATLYRGMTAATNETAGHGIISWKEGKEGEQTEYRYQIEYNWYDANDNALLCENNHTYSGVFFDSVEENAMRNIKCVAILKDMPQEQGGRSIEFSK